MSSLKEIPRILFHSFERGKTKYCCKKSDLKSRNWRGFETSYVWETNIACDLHSNLLTFCNCLCKVIENLSSSNKNNSKGSISVTKGDNYVSIITLLLRVDKRFTGGPAI